MGDSGVGAAGSREVMGKPRIGLAAALAGVACVVVPASARAQQPPLPEGIVEVAPAPPPPRTTPAPPPVYAPAPVPAAVLVPPSEAAPDPNVVTGPRAPRPGYHWEIRHAYGLAKTGAGVFAGAYVPGVVLGAIGGDWYPVIPVGGPIYGGARTLSTLDDGCQGDCRLFKLVRIIGGVFSIVDGAMQAGGLALVVTGLVWKRPVEVPDQPPAVTLSPLLLPGGGGLSLSCEFN